VLAAMAPVLWLPLVGNAPLQPPDAVHEVALVELHVSLEVPPGATIVGFAVKLAVGTAATVTVVVTIPLVPPAPLQVSEYDELAVMAPVLWLPLVGNAPLQPPEAVHEVALVELHVSLDVPPGATIVGFAVKLAVGTAATVTVVVTIPLVPPAPLQVSE
jgi:hypothetical protein